MTNKNLIDTNSIPTGRVGGNDCIFCKIAKGEIPAIKMWEDKKYVAFLDKQPLRKGHTILISKKHSDYLFDMKDGEYKKLMLKAKELARKLKSKFNTKRVIMLVEGYEVNHVHVHLIPSDIPLKITKEKITK